MTFLAWASAVWLTTIGASLIFLFERRRGERYGMRFRESLDAAIIFIQQEWAEHVPVVNKGFFRQLFHYSVHIILSSFLRFLQWTEQSIRRILRLNRKKAIVAVTITQDSHLQKVAAHKEEYALSRTEKQARKEAALRGDM